jgi:peptide-methionine (S)-S-oxide reductase
MLRVDAAIGLALTLLLGVARADDMTGVKPEQNPKYAVATFAGGCFWCMQPPFDHTKGVIKTIAGYTGGATVNPTYEQVSEGGTGHAESVDVIFDPAVVSYKELLQIFWHNVDPLVKDRQFCDSGHQYRTAIFYHGDEQKRLAEESKKEVEAKFKVPVQTEIVAASAFYPAEDYHQEYYKKNPLRYKFYRWNCGRDQRLKQLWGAEAGHIEE